MTASVPASPWTIGDFHVIGAAHTIVGEVLCEDAGLTAGRRVLDAACGSGNTALAAARRGCTVSGLDLYDKLIERARIRAQAEGFEIDFRSGNCEQLPYGDASFDDVLSTFGVMFAPDQQRAAAELLRVCKPGGTIALSNWTLESLPGGMFALGTTYGPPRPAGSHAPIEWGTVPGLRRLFGDREMRLFDRVVYMRFRTIDAMIETFRNYFGPMKMLFDNAPEERHAAIRSDLADLAARYNRATDGTLCAAMSYVNAVIRV
ncbi:MAG TPA: class I SAM-dependent methyltransferase [Candidatus Baltobacteraceae bacterium]|nr:class I SAM-dependent methyltransferase [Candidatus Baltobacteraceae bacterium]